MSSQAPPAAGVGPQRLTLQVLLKTMHEKGASDLHITTGSPPRLRIDGRMVPLRTEPLTAVQTKQLCYSVLTDSQKHTFEEENELDLSFGVKNLARFRANVYMQRGAVAAAFRQIPFEIKSLEQLGLPPILAEISRRPRGLVLLTGPTGSGKSTTLASMIDLVNTERQGHILTIEDPIEYLHEHRSCLINQREIGADTSSFKKALKYVLRQDPDVVLIGEMRDLETIEAALTISETGHLAFGTLHTNSAVQTINRILDVFPPYQQPQVRAQLSFVLEAVVCQQLIPKQPSGRALAVEIMIPTPAIRNLIREDKIHQLYSQMQVGRNKGMQTMNSSLAELVVRRVVSTEEAMTKSSDPDELRNMIMSGAKPTG
ncbi:MAG: type IV pili twitching motility protein PilT [Deltaproteobacteria bacterium RIFOXYA12_FULL_58_15]|nr:MAG: type IV pili twitching motility protein PilT [Deltaproteobacteria bacterium RIFOXYA12_FULL_58_15]OGR10570.1 MAG: type IV pili twitching motility protein PilT [Deltaproteobacteria bacterium RIFOXYB12_FULL_58_9]